MNNTLFCVPDYYPLFKCKMGACRSACCNGWPISISMEDYFKLIGENCSADLRRRIDCSLHLHEHPTSDNYAFIAPNYFGACPMRLDNGLCALHAELGERALSDVCRLYPRGIRTEGDLECSCSNSCEAVIEAFENHPEPLSFIMYPVSEKPPKTAGRTVFFETVGREQDIRFFFIKLIQDRTRSLPERIIRLGYAINAAEVLLKAKDRAGIDKLLSCGIGETETVWFSHSSEYMSSALELIEKILVRIDEHSKSVHDFGEGALKYFSEGNDVLFRYKSACELFNGLVPQWEIVFEHMLVNHMFFERFPFQDRPESIHEEFAALSLIYIMLRFLCVGWVAINKTLDSFTDVCASSFRYIDHTAFDRFASPLLREFGCADKDSVIKLLML